MATAAAASAGGTGVIINGQELDKDTVINLGIDYIKFLQKEIYKVDQREKSLRNEMFKYSNEEIIFNPTTETEIDPGLYYGFYNTASGKKYKKKFDLYSYESGDEYYDGGSSGGKARMTNGGQLFKITLDSTTWETKKDEVTSNHDIILNKVLFKYDDEREKTDGRIRHVPNSYLNELIPRGQGFPKIKQIFFRQILDGGYKHFKDSDISKEEQTHDGKYVCTICGKYIKSEENGGKIDVDHIFNLNINNILRINDKDYGFFNTHPKCNSKTKSDKIIKLDEEGGDLFLDLSKHAKGGIDGWKGDKLVTLYKNRLYIIMKNVIDEYSSTTDDDKQSIENLKAYLKNKERISNFTMLLKLCKDMIVRYQVNMQLNKRWLEHENTFGDDSQIEDYSQSSQNSQFALQSPSALSPSGRKSSTLRAQREGVWSGERRTPGEPSRSEKWVIQKFILPKKKEVNFISGNINVFLLQQAVNSVINQSSGFNIAGSLTLESKSTFYLNSLLNYLRYKHDMHRDISITKQTEKDASRTAYKNDIRYHKRAHIFYKNILDNIFILINKLTDFRRKLEDFISIYNISEVELGELNEELGDEKTMGDNYKKTIDQLNIYIKEKKELGDESSLSTVVEEGGNLNMLSVGKEKENAHMSFKKKKLSKIERVMFLSVLSNLIKTKHELFDTDKEYIDVPPWKPGEDLAQKKKRLKLSELILLIQYNEIDLRVKRPLIDLSDMAPSHNSKSIPELGSFSQSNTPHRKGGSKNKSRRKKRKKIHKYTKKKRKRTKRKQSKKNKKIKKHKKTIKT